MELVQALEDLLWWVQDGLDNADLTNRQYQRTVNCKNKVLQHIAELKKEPTVQADAPTDWVCSKCGWKNGWRGAYCFKCDAPRTA